VGDGQRRPRHPEGRRGTRPGLGADPGGSGTVSAATLTPEVEAQLERLEELNDRFGLALLRRAIAEAAGVAVDAVVADEPHDPWDE
jgi:hypothetical protein